ncbi:adenosine deaminase [Microbacterium indicum]|uniref:adenosine deaminase n=1 Tax=Microbacterium indicum TaxID=358100 RepID=UPI0003FCA3BD|nr:adenosine deaminase [Microbacterium indicum]
MTITETHSVQTAQGIRELRELPKGHLHIHMEACMRPATLAELAAEKGIPVPETQDFEGFAAFSETYRTLLEVLRTPEAVERLIHEIFEDNAADGAAWLELNVSPRFYDTVFGSQDAALEAFLAYSEAASVKTGVAFGFMVTIDRTAGVDVAIELAELAARFAGRGVVSLGLAAEERGNSSARFAEAFAIGKRAGLQITPHAGELVGPEEVRGALSVGADRILHGIRSVEDPSLVAELAERGVSLDVCPSSNVILVDSVPTIADHPLPHLLEAGVRCSINADDPILFGPGLLDEYEICRSGLGLSDEQLAACAWTSIETTLAPEAVKAVARERIDAWLAA